LKHPDPDDNKSPGSLRHPGPDDNKPPGSPGHPAHPPTPLKRG
jgi:hypothetical protein